MRRSHLICSLLVAGGLSVSVPFMTSVRAQSPVVGTAVRLDDQTEDHYIQQLRECRKRLNGAKDIVDGEKEDRGGHRIEAIHAIDKAIEAVDREIVEYKKATGQ